jgi:hypothetical protein
MLAMQMIGTHEAATECLRLAMIHGKDLKRGMLIQNAPKNLWLFMQYKLRL